MNVLVSAIVALALLAAQALGGTPALGAEVAIGREAMGQAHQRLTPELAQNHFGAPVYIDSEERDGLLRGEVYAEFAVPFERLATTIGTQAALCEALLLHENVRRCRPEDNPPAVRLGLGSSGIEIMGTLYELDYRYERRGGSDYVSVTLIAPQGPFGTRDNEVVFEAIPHDPKTTFLRVVFANRYGSMARAAARGYFATFGRSKVGFTLVDSGGGKPRFVGGLRGAVERNAMRYYLALVADVETATLPPDKRTEARIDRWFKLADHYPQLRGMSAADYHAQKLKDYRER